MSESPCTPSVVISRLPSRSATFPPMSSGPCSPMLSSSNSSKSLSQSSKASVSSCCRGFLVGLPVCVYVNTLCFGTCLDPPALPSLILDFESCSKEGSSLVAKWTVFGPEFFTRLDLRRAGDFAFFGAAFAFPFFGVFVTGGSSSSNTSMLRKT